MRKLTHSRDGYPVPTMGGLAEGVDACFKLWPTHAGGNMESLASQTDQHHHLVDRERFRSVMGHFASGVTIISTRHEGIDYGLTASAVSSLSLDPPMLLICVNRTSNTQKAIAQSQVFAVNILREHQSEVARHFASSRPQKFGGR